jgi:outer membrane protein TolC
MKSWIFALLGVASVASASELPSPLDLKGALLYAFDHNYPIRQARAQIKVDQGIVLTASSQLLPNVSASGQYVRNDASISQTFPESDATYQVVAKATQTVFAGGGILAGSRAAKLDKEAAMFDLQAAINLALLDVRTRFYTVILDKEKVGVQEENIKLFQRQLDDVQNQFHAGTVSNFEVLRARVALANAQPDLITARNDLRVAVEQLRQSLGVPAGPGGISVMPDVIGTLDFVGTEFTLESSLATARDHRPELMSLAKLAAAGQQLVHQAKAGYLPVVSLFGSYQWSGASGYQGSLAAFPFPIATGDINGWLLGVQGTWAIFDGRATEGRVKTARAQLEQARLNEGSEDLSIDVEVRQAFSTLEEAKELVNASVQTVGQAAEALRLANEKFHVGSATQLDVLTSQVAFTQAKTNQVQANYNYLVAVAQMRKASGLTDVALTN